MVQDDIQVLLLPLDLDLIDVMLLPAITFDCSSSNYHIIHELLSLIVDDTLLEFQFFAFFTEKMLQEHDYYPNSESNTGVLPT